MNQDWDAGFRTPVVIIHSFEGNHSYLMNEILRNKGDKFEFGNSKIQLLDIDAGKQSARISINYSRLSVPPIIYYKWPWEYISPAIPLTPLGPGKDIAIVNEKIIRMPRWSLRPILKSLADISSSYEFNNEDISKKIRQEALQTIIKIANKNSKIYIFNEE